MEKEIIAVEDLEHEDHVKLQEEWMKSMQDERDNELIEKLIARMKEEGFAKVHDPDYIRKAIDSLYPPGVSQGAPNPGEFASGYPIETPKTKTEFVDDIAGDLTDEENKSITSLMSRGFIIGIRYPKDLMRDKMRLEEFSKSDWCYFKQFVAREWSAIKELWKRWRGG